MDKKGIHWPSCMFFLFAVLYLVIAVSKNSLHDYFLAAGWACWGYSGIRLVRPDLFSQKISLSYYKPFPTNARPVDVVVQNIGLGLVLVGLVVRYVG